MQVEAIFENIGDRIMEELDKAQVSIYISVAWLTNRGIISVLQDKVESGCNLNVMYSNDEINRRTTDAFDLLIEKNANVYAIGNGDDELMHNKFCVIDHSTVITGSYNWSYKAETNHENITITYGVSTLAEQYISNFNNIVQQYFPDAKNIDDYFPVDKIIKRLETLKTFVVLEDIEDLKGGASKLKMYSFNQDINEILVAIEIENFGDAVSLIETFTKKYHQLSKWIDPEIAALQLEIKNIENQINAFDNEKIELEKVLSEFHHKHSIELGPTMLKLFELQKRKFKKDKERFEEIEQDEATYRGQYELEKDKSLRALNNEEEVHLKKLFRKATTFCHPDKFTQAPASKQKKAEGIYKQLIDANDNNDIERVTEILHQLEKGFLFIEDQDANRDKEILRATIKKLKQKLFKLELEIKKIKNSETYVTICSISNWDIYFKNLKENLELQINRLSNNL